jgi:predicted RNA methylase
MLAHVDAVITDPPYSTETHAMHNERSMQARDSACRAGIDYDSLSHDDVRYLADQYHRICAGWIVWMTDAELALIVRNALRALGRVTFPPLPFYQPGRSIRLSGDGPCSWTDWIVVARTRAQKKWGTLPGGYIAGQGWKDKNRIGGKPTKLMEALISDYSRPGDTVLDTHMGAGTTGVAAVKLGRKFIGCEIDRAAFTIACERIARTQAQGVLFQPEPTPAPAQEGLLDDD